MPPLPPLDEPLRDARVVLRDAAERDIPDVLIAHDDDPELYLQLGHERPPTGAELGRWAESAQAERAAGTAARLTVLEPGSDVCRGQLNFHHVDWENRRAEIGIWLAAQARGRGAGSHALRLAGEWLLAVCDFERVEALTDPGNEAMLRAARAAGFQHEGVLRSYQLERGRRVDVAVLSLVRADMTEARG
jgi:ribosomal-protein-alanine N-acetyltransferase